MTTGRRSARESAVELAPAGPAGRGEHWSPVAVAIIVAAGLHVALPARYRVQPAWVVPAVLLGLLAVLIAGIQAASIGRKPGCEFSPASSSRS